MMDYKKREDVFGLTPYYCIVCKKEIYPGPEYAYHIGPRANGKFCCSYSCYRNVTPAVRRKKTKLSVSDQKQVIVCLKNGYSIMEIARMFNTSTQVIQYYRKKLLMEAKLNENQKEGQTGGD